MSPRERQLLMIAAEHGPSWPLPVREFRQALAQPRWHEDVSEASLRPVLSALVRRGLLAKTAWPKMVIYVITAAGREALERQEVGSS